MLIYADDAVKTTTSSLGSIKGDHQEVLNKTNVWLESTKLTLNAEKTKTMLFDKKYKNYGDTKNTSKKIEKLKSFEHLGITLDKNFTFENHVTSLKNKISQQCGLFYGLRKILTEKKTASFGLYNLCSANFTIWKPSLGIT